jgi:hypothetical protein
MKMKKRLISLFMVVCTAVLMCGISGADDTARVSARSYQTEYRFDGDIDKEKAQLIINSINGEETVTSRGNVLCIFGHSIAHMTVEEIKHRYYATAPRCLKTTYDVAYCTRSGCNYTVWTQIGTSIRIYCCS